MADLMYSSQEEYEATAQEMIAAQKQRQRDRYKIRAEIPSWAVKPLSSLNIHEAARAKCQVFIDQFIAGTHGGKGLLLWGKPGRGKTSMAAAALCDVLQEASHQALGATFEEGRCKRPGYYITYGDLLDLYSLSYRDPEADDLKRAIFGNSLHKIDNVRVLVIDDVGHEHDGGSGFTTATLHRLLRGRFDRGYPTIITSNLDPYPPTLGGVSAWETRYDGTIQSFIEGQAFEWVEAAGKDRRK